MKIAKITTFWPLACSDLSVTVSIEELTFLGEKYESLSGSITQDGVIDMQEFQASLGFKEATTAARLFNCLDCTPPLCLYCSSVRCLYGMTDCSVVNGDKMIDFSEFATGIAICAGHLGLDEMIKCAKHSQDLEV